ncbi:MAG: hypothetical protein K2Q01_10690, partial [Rickettsiales bacterium]|nr:hypothetical protein [Rickettsiales bacterium]
MSESDGVWALSAWERALPMLHAQGHEIAGLWTVQPKLGRWKGFRIPLWYLRRLGAWDFALLALFALRHAWARHWGGRPRSLRMMCEMLDVPYFETATPNDEALVRWLRQEGLDVLLITVGHILKPEVLAAVK